ncbi:MAG: hypothetical protein AAFY31_00845 [Pseudomonadota bacterium]
MLSNLPVFLLGIVMIWFLWPLVADPINRRRGVQAATDRDARADDLFRMIAKHAAPKHDLVRTDRGKTI